MLAARSARTEVGVKIDRDSAGGAWPCGRVLPLRHVRATLLGSLVAANQPLGGQPLAMLPGCELSAGGIRHLVLPNLWERLPLANEVARALLVQHHLRRLWE